MTSRLPRLAAAVLALALLGPPAIAAAPHGVAKPSRGEVGIASVYSEALDGRKTAAGERHDSDALTAAHRTLPIDSEVRVTNLETQRSVVVRINDRGPAPKNRIIDLSPAAAKALGMDPKAIAKVRIDVLHAPAAPR